jgi:hypothetical protein
LAVALLAEPLLVVVVERWTLPILIRMPLLGLAERAEWDVEALVVWADVVVAGKVAVWEWVEWAVVQVAAWEWVEWLAAVVALVRAWQTAAWEWAAVVVAVLAVLVAVGLLESVVVAEALLVVWEVEWVAVWAVVVVVAAVVGVAGVALAEVATRAAAVPVPNNPVVRNFTAHCNTNTVSFGTWNRNSPAWRLSSGHLIIQKRVHVFFPLHFKDIFFHE